MLMTWVLFITHNCGVNTHSIAVILLEFCAYRDVRSYLRGTKTQKAHPLGWASHLFDAWQFPTLAWGDPTLPSALRRFTSEFGMGSGGTTALSPPGKFCFSIAYTSYCVSRQS